jgi:hypothetical protein
MTELAGWLASAIRLVWDGAPIHRSVFVKNYILSTRGRLQVARLPAYAPELNPIRVYVGASQESRDRQLRGNQSVEADV